MNVQEANGFLLCLFPSLHPPNPTHSLVPVEYSLRILRCTWTYLLSPIPWKVLPSPEAPPSNPATAILSGWVRGASPEFCCYLLWLQSRAISLLNPHKKQSLHCLLLQSSCNSQDPQWRVATGTQNSWAGPLQKGSNPFSVYPHWLIPLPNQFWVSVHLWYLPECHWRNSG